MYGGNNWGASQSYGNQPPQRGPPAPWQRGPPPRTGPSQNLPRPVPASGSDVAQFRNQSQYYNSRFDKPFYEGGQSSQRTFNHGFGPFDNTSSGPTTRHHPQESHTRSRPISASGSNFHQFRNQSNYDSDWNAPVSDRGQEESNRVEVDNSFTIKFEEPEIKSEIKSEPFHNQGSQPNYSHQPSSQSFSSSQSSSFVPPMNEPNTGNQRNIRKYPPYKGPQISEPKDDYIFKEPDQNPNFDDSKIHLDWYNSDLNMDIDCMDYCSVRAMSSQGFGYMWSG